LLLVFQEGIASNGIVVIHEINSPLLALVS